MPTVMMVMMMMMMNCLDSLFEKCSDIKFQENPSSGLFRADGRTDIQI